MSALERIGSHEVHPVASIFPLLEGTELRDLADDIGANGLREPIVVVVCDGRRVILDGRNRLRACELAGVSPVFQAYEGPTDIVDRKGILPVKEAVARGDLSVGVAADLAVRTPEVQEDVLQRTGGTARSVRAILRRLDREEQLRGPLAGTPQPRAPEIVKAVLNLPLEPNGAARELVCRLGREFCRDLVIALDAECERGDSR